MFKESIKMAMAETDDTLKKMPGISDRVNNLWKLAENGSTVNVRIPIIPDFTYFENNIIEIFKYAASL